MAKQSFQVPHLPPLPLSDKELFPFLNVFIVVWAAMLLLPRWKGTRWLTWTTVLLTCCLYTWLLTRQLQGGMKLDARELMTWDGVHKLLSNKSAVLPAWLHFFVTDAVTMFFVLRDAQANGVPHLLVMPCLAGIVMAGPSGLLLYAVMRTLKLAVRAAPKEKVKTV